MEPEQERRGALTRLAWFINKGRYGLGVQRQLRIEASFSEQLIYFLGERDTSFLRKLEHCCVPDRLLHSADFGRNIELRRILFSGYQEIRVI